MCAWGGAALCVLALQHPVVAAGVSNIVLCLLMCLNVCMCAETAKNEMTVRVTVLLLSSHICACPSMHKAN